MKKFIPIVLIIFLSSCANAPKTGQGAAIGTVASTAAGAIIVNTQDQKDGTSFSSKPGKYLDSTTFPGNYYACIGKGKTRSKSDCRGYLDIQTIYVFNSDGTGSLEWGPHRNPLNDPFTWTHQPGNIIQIVYTGKGNGPIKKGQKETFTREESNILKGGGLYYKKR